ncbi:MAG: HAMP domain-containing protein [Armatimonadetes bacterium]|nr:HAMP domain-containing protein [Armatimonadota bacterium]
MSLRTKLVIWNSLLFTVAISVFGAVQLVVSKQSALDALDNELKNRAMGVANAPMMRSGPFGPGDGGPPPMANLDLRRPRVFDLNGAPLGWETEPWSREMLAATMKGQTVYGNGQYGGIHFRVLSTRVRRPEGMQVVVQVGQESDSLALAQGAQLRSFALILPLIALVSGVLAWLLSRLVMGPIALLTNTAEAIAAEPSVPRRIEAAGTDEMGRLSTAFNTMTDRLQSSNVQLAAALEAQRRFTGDAAHELRTPLTSISLAAQNARNPRATVEEVKDSVETIERSATSMQKLTSLLLALSRLDAAEKQLETVPVDIVPILQSLAADLSIEGDGRLRWEIEDPALKVRANADATRQIVSNLLENAFAYTPAKGTVTIVARRDTVEVRDTGEGIAADHLPHLFDRFYRADPSRSRAKGGHGLGLAIAKSLAEAQGALLSVESELGKGTVFTLSFVPLGA